MLKFVKRCSLFDISRFICKQPYYQLIKNTNEYEKGIDSFLIV